MAMAAAVPAIDLPGSRQEPRPVDLEVSQLCLSWNGTGSVIDRLSFIVCQGEAVALIGPNGSGKTTLMRLLLGLVRPKSGSVRLFGEELGTLDGARLRRLRAQVGLISQRHNLVPRLCVLTNVIHGALCRSANPALWRQGTAPRAVREEALACLDRVGLAGLAGRRADGLSGGESQRVAIARALMQRPRILLADEPVASLDPQIAEEVMALFVGLMKRDGITLLYSSHSLDDALRYSDRVLGLNRGAIRLDAPSRALGRPELRALYDA
ncbi:MAG: ATP-binding cassette domain-containing protein [Pseudomonadota bacterium]|nr:ATP-binding cassette domain-containing protein [Gammaproteobacteria bacterium]MDQ3582417.1 ATP-binding cassette domain-containing protein [Pseudomonadota bacterium]